MKKKKSHEKEILLSVLAQLVVIRIFLHYVNQVFLVEQAVYTDLPRMYTSMSSITLLYSCNDAQESVKYKTLRREVLNLLIPYGQIQHDLNRERKIRMHPIYIIHGRIRQWLEENESL